ncbi:MAG: hypothetical protein JXA99_00610 [Candidatus Lokiarchaeota archaeon]|nr:hypothetical protein [Candidatus Lokiarchaeota archaeon]
MSSIIKKFRDLINGFLLFILTLSGFVIAVILRISGFNGNLIVLIGVIIEIFGIILCFLILKTYLNEKITPEESVRKKKKIQK